MKERYDDKGNREDIWKKALRSTQDRLSGNKTNTKPGAGGKREGAGRPAPLGRKEVCSVRLTPDVAKFCREQGFSILEDSIRKTKEFKAWLKQQLQK